MLEITPMEELGMNIHQIRELASAERSNMIKIGHDKRPSGGLLGMIKYIKEENQKVLLPKIKEFSNRNREIAKIFKSGCNPY